MFGQNFSAVGLLRVPVRKFRKIGRPTYSKKGLSAGVFSAPNRHTLSDLREIWYTYGDYRAPLSAEISPKTGTRWLRYRVRGVFLDGSWCAGSRTQTCGTSTVKFGWNVAEATFYGDTKPFWSWGNDFCHRAAVVFPKIAPGNSKWILEQTSMTLPRA